MHLLGPHVTFTDVVRSPCEAAQSLTDTAVGYSETEAGMVPD